MNDTRNDPRDPKLQELVKASIRPANARLGRDLWPEMQARLSTQQRHPSTALRFRLKWWEWTLAGGDLAAAFYAPEAIPALLYHL